MRYNLVVYEILWTEGNEAHIARHGVTRSDVEQATERPYYERDGRDDTTLIYGRTYAGRYLLIVLAESEDGRMYVVTARDMTPPERREFSRKAN